MAEIRARALSSSSPTIRRVVGACRTSSLRSRSGSGAAWPCVGLVWWLLLGCGSGNEPSPPSFPTSGVASDAPAKSALIESPHDREAPPADPQGQWHPETRWWEQDAPCPEGTVLFGGAPPGHQEVRCRTEKGRNQGPATRFHADGKKAEEGRYDDHFATGVWVQWDAQSRKLMETPYVEGEKHGVETEWYPDGSIKSQRRYQGGKRHGLTEIWDETGRKRSALDYHEGKQHGVATYWGADGELARVERWEQGELVGSDQR